MNDAATSIAEEIGSRWKPYPAYKNSGVEWLGEIPAHWAVTRNRGLFTERSEKGFPELLPFSVSQREGVVLQEYAEDQIVRSSADKTNYKRIKKDDLVYNKMRMWQGAVGVAPDEGTVSPAYVVCAPRTPFISRFFEYLYRTPLFIIESGRYSYGICDDMNSLRFQDFKTMFSIGMRSRGRST